MTPEQLDDLLRYRMNQASETLHEAALLRESGTLRGAINRAYYAMFYAVLALLATKQLGTSKHSGAISLFDREFVKTGIFAKEFSRTLHLAFDRRQMHDYGEVTELDAEMVDFTIEDATIFVTGIDSHLRQDGHL